MYVTGLAYGIAASVAIAGFFYLAGLVLTPRRWNAFLGHTALPVIGAAIYVLLSWIATTSHEIPLNVVAQVFGGGVLVLAAVRVRAVAGVIGQGIASRHLWTEILSYSLLFTLAYVIALPPGPGIHLPPIGTGDLDLLTHVRYARHLQLFGTAHLEQPSFDYLRSPAVSFLLAAFSLAYARDPLAAAMPLQFALTALVGFMAACVSRSLFHLSSIFALAFACVLITSPYLQAVAGAYRLVALFVIPILLYQLWATVTLRSERMVDLPATAVCFGSVGLLLFFAEPTVLVVALVLQGMAIALVRRRRPSGMLMVSAALPPLVLLIAFPDRVRWSLSSINRSDAGIAAAVTLTVIALAAAVRFMLRSGVLDKLAQSPTDRRLAVALARYVAIAIAAGNVTVQAVKRPDAKRLPASSRRIEQLAEYSLRELTLRVEDDTSPVLPALTRYYLPATKVHVAVRMRDLDFETISRKSPMLIQSFGCESAGHDETLMIRGVGCLLFAPPSIEVGRAYLFNRPMLFLNSQDMTVRNAEGRLNRRGRAVPLRLLADPARIRIDRDLYVNLLLGTSQQAGDPRRVAFAWGTGRAGEAVIDGRQWVSLRVASNDWAGNRVWALPVTVQVLNVRTVLFGELSVTEQPLGALVE